MFNPAGGIYERINSLIKLDEERGNKKEPIVEMRKQQKEQLGVTDIIDDDKRMLVTPAGKATTKEMKKELFKKMGVVQDA